ncbi:hypothetical protein ACJVC5_09285 [Peredibacter sp. HCB2-198]|uniref:hypothetical protein n=1 Tax=Peredibacter sp. HCB2-198 TaxID=3383025 RepID=UPI0038B5AFB4
MLLVSCQEGNLLTGNINVIVKDSTPSAPLVTGHQIESVNLTTVEVELRGKCPGTAQNVEVEFEGQITTSPCDVISRNFVARVPVTDPNDDRLLSYILAESIASQTLSTSYQVNYHRPATPQPSIASNNSQDFSTNVTTPILEGTCNSDTTDGMEVRVDGGAWSSGLVSCVNGQWSLNLPGLSGDPAQEYLIEVRTVNSTSDEPYSEIESIRVLVDTALPSMPIMAADANTIDLTPTWSWISGGAGEGTYRYKLDDTDLTVGAYETTLNFFTPPSDLVYGPHTLYVQERDEVGNWSPSGSQTITIQCPAGNSYDGTACVPCPPGSYQTASNLLGACLQAPQGTFVSGSGATTASSCTNKPLNAVDVIYDTSSGLTTNTCPVASVSSCSANYAPDGVTCRLMCPLDQYWTGASCASVGIGYYSPANDDNRYSCTNMPANATSVAYSGVGGGTNNCPFSSVTACAPTYAPDGLACRLMCPLDQYWNGSACVMVGIGYFSPALDDILYSCTNMPANAVSVVYSGVGGGTNNCPFSSVTCNANYTPEGLTCRQLCPLDQYWNGSACVAVGTGYYSPANDDNRYSCTNLPANTSSVTYSGSGGGTNNCPIGSITGCNANYVVEGLTCRQLCSLDQYWDGSACVAVGAGYYSPADDDNRYSCTNIPSNATSVVYSGSGGGANNCPISSVSCDTNYVPNGATCRLTCGLDQFWNGSACVNVGNGFYSPINNDFSYFCTNLPANAMSATYSGPGGGVNNCPIASVTGCSAGYVPSGAVCLDNTPSAITFNNTTGVNPSNMVGSNVVVVSNFDGPLTATCSGCSNIILNGVWSGTSVAGVMPGDSISLAVASSASFLGTVNASLTLGATTSNTWSVQTRAANSCTGTPWGTIAHGGAVTGYSTSTAVSPATCSSQVRTCNDGTLSGTYANTACTNYPAVTLNLSYSPLPGVSLGQTYSITATAAAAGGSGSNYSYEWQVTYMAGGSYTGGGSNNWLTYTMVRCDYAYIEFRVRARDNNLGAYSAWYLGTIMDENINGTCD